MTTCTPLYSTVLYAVWCCRRIADVDVAHSHTAGNKVGIRVRLLFNFSDRDIKNKIQNISGVSP